MKINKIKNILRYIFLFFVGITGPYTYAQIKFLKEIVRLNQVKTESYIDYYDGTFKDDILKQLGWHCAHLNFVQEYKLGKYFKKMNIDTTSGNITFHQYQRNLNTDFLGVKFDTYSDTLVIDSEKDAVPLKSILEEFVKKQDEDFWRNYQYVMIKSINKYKNSPRKRALLFKFLEQKRKNLVGNLEQMNFCASNSFLITDIKNSMLIHLNLNYAESSVTVNVFQFEPELFNKIPEVFKMLVKEGKAIRF